MPWLATILPTSSSSTITASWTVLRPISDASKESVRSQPFGGSSFASPGPLTTFLGPKVDGRICSRRPLVTKQPGDSRFGTPECAYLESRAQPELLEILPKVTAAYLGGDDPSVYSDTDRIPAKSGSTWGALTTGVIRSCGVWGNDRLAFASMKASYESPTRIGHIPVLLALRRSSGQWRVLSAARDPITNTEFIRDIVSIASLLTGGRGLGASPEPATLLSPLIGQLPKPADGQRFGPFRWRSSQTTEVVADIAEFAYHDDARLFFRFGGFPGAPNLVSEAHLWTTFSEWSWRIWSVTSDGNITFSEARTFTH